MKVAKLGSWFGIATIGYLVRYRKGAIRGDEVGEDTSGVKGTKKKYRKRGDKMATDWVP